MRKMLSTKVDVDGTETTPIKPLGKDGSGTERVSSFNGDVSATGSIPSSNKGIKDQMQSMSTKNKNSSGSDIKPTTVDKDLCDTKTAPTISRFVLAIPTIPPADHCVGTIGIGRATSGVYVGGRPRDGTSLKTDDSVSCTEITPTVSDNVDSSTKAISSTTNRHISRSETMPSTKGKDVLARKTISPTVTEGNCVTLPSSSTTSGDSPTNTMSSSPNEDIRGTEPRRHELCMASSEVVIREGTVNDHAAVTDLIDEGGLHDYLPALYTHLASDPDNFPFVATWNGKVVGHIMASVLDGGLTTLIRSGRVHKSYRGQGIYKALLKHAHRFVSQQVPHHIHDIISLTDREDGVSGRFLKIGYRPVYRREGLQMFYRTPTPRPAEPTKTSPRSTTHVKVRELTRSDLCQILDAPGICRELFPQGMLYNWYVGYRLLGENVRHFITPWGGAFASLTLVESSARNLPCPIINRNKKRRDENSSSPNLDLSECDYGPLSSIDKVKSDETVCCEFFSPDRVAMLTFYNCHSTTFGAFYALDIYAREGLSRDHFRAHLREHLDNLQRRFPDEDVNLALTFDTSVSRECVTTCLAEQGIVDLMPLQEKWQILYERPAKR